MGVVEDAIGVRKGGNRAECLIRLQVEDDDGAATASIRNKAAIHTGHNGYTVIALLPGDVAESLAIFVQHDGVGTAWDKKKMLLGVHRNVIPRPFSADVERPADPPLRLGQGRGRKTDQRDQAGGKDCTVKLSHELYLLTTAGTR